MFGRPPKAQGRQSTMSAAAAISFSFTFLAVSIAMLVGVIPQRTIMGGQIDVNVLLLFVPLCALILAILVEVIRLIVGGNLKVERPRQHNPLTALRPGQGEG